MKHYYDVCLGPKGLPIPNVSVTVWIAGTGQTQWATIYSDDGITTKANPTTSDALGNVDFYVADGRYDLQFSGPGITSRLETDIEISDITQAATSDSSAVFKNLNNIRFADQFAGGSSTGGIQEAINDLPSGGGCVVISPNTTATLTATININKTNIAIRGFGPSSVINVNHGSDVFNVTSSGFVLSDLSVSYAFTSTRSGKAFVLAGANIGEITNLVVTGNATTPTNGMFFSVVGTSGAWTFDNIIFIEGGTPTWDSIISIVNNSGSVTAASYFIHNIDGGGKFLTAGILLDGAIDTFQWTQGGIDGLTGTSGPTILVRNTVGGFIDPRWIHFNGVSVEAVGQTAVKVDNVRDFQYYGYIASATTGVAFGAAALGANIHDTVFTNIGQSAITVNAAALFTNIHNNYFDDTCNSANNTFDTVSVAANAIQFVIIGNTWRNANGVNKPRYGINIQAGTSVDFEVIGNQMAGATFGTAAINNGSTSTTGLTQNIFGNAVVGNTPIRFPAGSATTLGLALENAEGTGFFSASGTSLSFRSNNANQFLTGSSVHRWASGTVQSWSSGDPNAAAGDVNASRASSGVLQIGTGETANALGKIQAAVYIPTGSTSQKSESAADTSVLSVTPVALAGTYRLTFDLSVSAAASAVLGWTATWTDSNGAAQTPTNLALFQSGAAAPALTFTTSAASNYYGSATIDINNSATAIVIKFTLASGTITAKASATVERLI